jgi:hypothetical protein
MENFLPEASIDKQGPQEPEPQQADKWRTKLRQKADTKEKSIAIEMSLLPESLGPVPPVYLRQCVRTKGTSWAIFSVRLILSKFT